MRIDLNGQPVTTTAATLADLIAEQGFEAACVASALDGDFVPRSQRATTPLREGARVEVLAPMQGG